MPSLPSEWMVAEMPKIGSGPLSSEGFQEQPVPRQPSGSAADRLEKSAGQGRAVPHVPDGWCYFISPRLSTCHVQSRSPASVKFSLTASDLSKSPALQALEPHSLYSLYR